MELTTPRLVGAVCALMFVVVAVQAAFPAGVPVPPPPGEPEVECVGESIPVDYTFAGWNEPHACAVQCEDDEPRYILYSDGQATQCEPPPGCNDLGEDKGILCRPPLTSPAE